MTSLRIVARRASSSLVGRAAVVSPSAHIVRPRQRPQQPHATAASTPCRAHLSRTSQQQHQRRSFASAATTTGAATGADAQLEVPIAPEQCGRPIGQVLKEYCTSSTLKLKPSSYLIAFSSTSSTHALGLADAVPAQTTSLTFHTFASHLAAREAFWRTAAFVLAAALADTHGAQLRIAGAPGLRSEGAGGEGFALSWLVELEGTRTDEGGDALQRAVRYAQETKAATAPSAMELQKLTARVQKAAARDQAFEWLACSRAEAEAQLSSNAFKLEELAARYPDEEEVRLVRLGAHIDLAPQPGKPLLERTGTLRNALLLTDCSSATWVPVQPSASSTSVSAQILLHARGIAFPTKALLTAHLAAQEAAQTRDHRLIGASQGLFFTHDASPGTPFLLPHGTRLARKVERVVRDLYDTWGYDEVVTPQLMRRSLWERSGHWENYREDMFGVRGFVDVDAKEMQRKGCCDAIADGKEEKKAGGADEFGLKPMNCPGHCLVFASAERSYRDLPIRYAEFSPLHRNESSGSLSGLTRVRRFHQDDAHVFCAPAQVSSEITSMLRMLTSAYTTFGFRAFELVLSTRPSAYIGTLAEWDLAESSLRQALNASGKEWTLNEADGAFYGPKIDVRLVDAAGRKHQTATIQLDFQLPQRFGLRYADPEADGGTKAPVMIHRAILGSVERFMAILIEQTEGRWPFWLSPRQAVVLPIAGTQEHLAHAQRVRDFLKLGPEVAAYKQRASSAAGEVQQPPRPTHVFHVDVDASKERFSKRVRNAAVQRYNFVLVVGDEEVRNGTVRVGAREEVPGEQESARPVLQREMGEWKLEDLRELFCKLDSNHW